MLHIQMQNVIENSGKTSSKQTQVLEIGPRGPQNLSILTQLKMLTFQLLRKESSFVRKIHLNCPILGGNYSEILLTFKKITFSYASH